ncbi:histidine phosphatase family protein [Sphingomonas zeae]
MIRGARAPHRFVFVRHAQATCNTLADDQLVTCYDTAAPLTLVGREQAIALAAALPASLVGDTIFTSPLRRAVETARPLAERFRLALRLDDRLTEMRAGTVFAPPITVAQWDGLLEQRVCEPDREAHPGLEPLADQAARVRSFLHERHRDRGDEGVTTVVTHAFTIELALLALLGLGLTALRDFRIRISNAAVHVVENDAVGQPARLMLVNARHHLGGWL